MLRIFTLVAGTILLLVTGVVIAPRPTFAVDCNYCWCGTRGEGGATQCLDNIGRRSACEEYCSGRSQAVIHCDDRYHNYNDPAGENFLNEAPSCAGVPPPDGGGAAPPGGGAAAPGAGGAAAPARPVVPGAQYQGGAVVENLAETANPIGTTSVASFAGKTINVIMGILGSIALLMFIWGGFLWLTSAGNADRITKGKNTLIWATIGLALIFAAYAVVNFVLTRLIGVL